MFQFIENLADRFTGKVLLGQRRSSQWPKVRKEYLAEHPNCECCGGSKGIEIHHVLPFHLYPELELTKENLMSLCRKKGCHLSIGHLYSYKSYNPDIGIDIEKWREKVKNRP